MKLLNISEEIFFTLLRKQIGIRPDRNYFADSELICRIRILINT